ncbi:MAG: hypothetical protein RI973_340 [Bacteroidota bacterium]|jgi:hypothetical protein
MKNQIAINLIILCLLSTASLSAQNQKSSFYKVSISVGTGLTTSAILGDATNAMPPVNARIGYQFSPNFGLSGFAGYAVLDSKPYIESDGKSIYTQNKQLVTGLRAEMKRPVTKFFEVYGGGMLGFSSSKVTEYDLSNGNEFTRPVDGPTPFDPNAPAGSFLYSGFVGGQYFLKNNLGTFVEVGLGGASILNFGLTARI